MTIIESPGDPSRSSTVPGITSTFRMLSWEKLWWRMTTTRMLMVTMMNMAMVVAVVVAKHGTTET